jgi:hypothetical protein
MLLWIKVLEILTEPKIGAGECFLLILVKSDLSCNRIHKKCIRCHLWVLVAKSTDV